MKQHIWKSVQIGVVFVFAIVLATSSKEFAELPKVLGMATGAILIAMAVGRVARPRHHQRCLNKIPD